MAVEITEFDPAAYLDDDAAIAAYLTDALETQDVALISDAIGVIARAKGMKQIAQDAGVSRESLYRALSSAGKPRARHRAQGTRVDEHQADGPAQAGVRLSPKSTATPSLTSDSDTKVAPATNGGTHVSQEASTLPF